MTDNGDEIGIAIHQYSFGLPRFDDGAHRHGGDLGAAAHRRREIHLIARADLAGAQRDRTRHAARRAVDHIDAARLQFLRETVGKLTNVRLLIPASAIMYWEMVTAPLLRRTGIPITASVLADKVVDREAYERVFDAMEAERVDGLVVADAPEHITNREVIVDLAARHRLRSDPGRERKGRSQLVQYVLLQACSRGSGTSG